MKCPYRKIVIRLNTEMINSREVDFADCYKNECPFYIPEIHFGGGISTTEYCKKVAQEKA